MTDIFQEIETSEALTQVEYFAGLTPSVVEQLALRSVENGETDPLSIAAAMACIAKAYEGLRATPQFAAAVVAEIERSREGNGKSVTRYGIEARVMGTTKYDYKKTNDPHLAKLEAEKDAILQKVKDRKAYLKSLQSEAFDALSEGEAINKPKATDKQTFSITFLNR